MTAWMLAAFGLAWVLADSKISLPLRIWLDRPNLIAKFFLTLLECVACTGFHIGWIGYLAGLAPFDHWYVSAFCTCATNLVLAKFVGMLDD